MLLRRTVDVNMEEQIDKRSPEDGRELFIPDACQNKRDGQLLPKAMNSNILPVIA